MWTSGRGCFTATSFNRRKSSASSTNWLFQNTLPSRSTAITTFSGFVCVGRLRSSGRSTGMFCTTTGMVMRKMMSSTSITSTSGVVLIWEFRSSSSACPTCIAMSGRLVLGVAAAKERHLEAAAEAAHLLHRDAVPAHEPVVAEHGRHRDGEAERGHDQRLAHGPSHLVDGGLARDPDGGECVVDAPDGTEEADEGSGRADRGEECQTRLQPIVDHVHGAVQRHGDPSVEVDLLLGHRRVILDRDNAFLRHVAKGAVFAQFRSAGVHAALGGPELSVGFAPVREEPRLFDVLDDADVPGADRHDDEDDERAARHEVALLPERLDAVGIFYRLGRGGAIVARRWRLRRHDHARGGTGGWRRRSILRGLSGHNACQTRQQHGKENHSWLFHDTPYSSLHRYSMRAHARVGWPSTVAGLKLQSSRAARAASSRRR